MILYYLLRFLYHFLQKIQSFYNNPIIFTIKKETCRRNKMILKSFV